MVLVEALKGGASSMRISPPLLLYTHDSATASARVLTREAEVIYRDCDFSGFYPYK